MKILYYAPYSAPADAQILGALRGLGHELTYLCSGPIVRQGVQALGLNIIHHEAIPAPDSGAFLGIRRRMHRGMVNELQRFWLKEELKSGEYQVVIASDLELGIDPAVDAFRQTKQVLPIIAISHGSDALHVPQRSEKQKKQVIEATRRAKSVLSFSTSHDAALRQLLGGPPPPSQVFPLWVDTERFHPRTDGPAPKRILAPRGSKEVYRPELVLKAFAELAPESGWRMTMRTDSDHLAALTILAQSLGCHDRIDWLTEALPDDDMPKLYRDHAIVLQATLDESFGLTLIEAMASGCALCLTETGPSQEILGESASDQSCPKDGSQLGAILKRLCTNEAHLVEVASQNRARTARFFAKGDRIAQAKHLISGILSNI